MQFESIVSWLSYVQNSKQFRFVQIGKDVSFGSAQAFESRSARQDGQTHVLCVVDAVSVPDFESVFQRSFAGTYQESKSKISAQSRSLCISRNERSAVDGGGAAARWKLN